MPNSETSLFDFIPILKGIALQLNNADRNLAPGVDKFLVPINRFIELHDEKINDYYPKERIQRAIDVIQSDASVFWAFQNHIKGIIEIYVVYKIFSDVMDRYYMTVFERKNVNQIVKFILTNKRNIDRARETLTNDQITDRIYLQEMDNHYVGFEDADLVEKIKDHFREQLRVADEFEEKSRRIFPNLDPAEFERQYLEVLKFDVGKFRKKIFPELYGSIFLTENDSQRHRRLLLFNVFHALYPYQFLSVEEWANMDRGGSSYETYQDNQVRNFIGV